MKKLLFLFLPLLLVGLVFGFPTTENPHVDTYGGGRAIVLATGNQLECPSHLQDWYAGNHYNCFQEESLTDKQVSNMLSKGWTLVPWGQNYWSDHHIIKICGAYVCKIIPIEE